MTRLTALLLALLGCAGTTAPAGTSGQPLAAEAPAAGTLSLDGITLATFPEAGKHSFSADRGQVVVVDAWATWCGPCVRSLPQLQALRREFAGRGVRVYAVTVDEDRAQVLTFLASARIGDLPVLLDPGGFVLEDKLKLKQMPTTWVVDRNGRVRYTLDRFDGNLDEVRSHVNALLKDGQ